MVEKAWVVRLEQGPRQSRLLLYSFNALKLEYATEVIEQLLKLEYYVKHELEYSTAPTEQSVEPEYSAKSSSQDPTSGYYIWRTSSDDRVRPSHAANSGLIFEWSNPPPTGHPGKGYGCRCRAEPYAHGELFASIKQRLENLFLILERLGLTFARDLASVNLNSLSLDLVKDFLAQNLTTEN